jgi:hypothetical protein
MNDLAKEGSKLPANREMMGINALAQAIGELNIMEPPPLPNDQWWLPRKFTKSKIRDLDDMSRSVVSIHENNLRALNAKIESAISLMTASDRLKLRFEEIESARETLKHLAEMQKLERMEKQTDIKKKLLECEVLQMEVEAQKLDHKVKLRNYKEVLSDIEDEDRD